MAARRSPARAALLRNLLLFTPFLLIALVALVFLLVETASDGASGGRVVGLALVGLLTLLLAYQVVQSLRDLFAPLVETTGEVERRWSRADLILLRSNYVFVARNVFRLPPEQWVQVEVGDTVRIVHYPHTGAVEEVEVLVRADERGRRTP